MNTRNEELDIPDTPTSRIAYNAMVAVEELLLRGVVFDVIAETVPDYYTDEVYTRWWKNTHYLLRDIHSRATRIERNGQDLAELEQGDPSAIEKYKRAQEQGDAA